VEEEKKNGWKQKRGKKGQTKDSNDVNGHRRTDPGYEFDFLNEHEVTLVEALGRDQVSIPSDSELLASYSPPRSEDGTRQLAPDTVREVRNADDNEMRNTNIAQHGDLKEEVMSAEKN
jgi:hypothetical protein